MTAPEDLPEDLALRRKRVLYRAQHRGTQEMDILIGGYVAGHLDGLDSAALDRLETLLQDRRYLTGDAITEADWRLFTTLVRFDIGYYGAFRCNLRRIEEYDALSHYLRELYQWLGIAATVKLDLIKTNYWTLANVNPSGIVPIGPIVDFDKPHDREHLPSKGIWVRG